jgi:hypothetical protein
MMKKNKMMKIQKRDKLNRIQNIIKKICKKNKNMDTLFEQSPTKVINTEHLFGIKCIFDVLGFEKRNDHVPEIDETYKFDPETTLSILAGFSNNRRVLISGYHGTAKSNTKLHLIPNKCSVFITLVGDCSNKVSIFLFFLQIFLIIF